MKKLLGLILTGLLVLFIAGCGDSGGSDTNSNDNMNGGKQTAFKKSMREFRAFVSWTWN